MGSPRRNARFSKIKARHAPDCRLIVSDAGNSPVGSAVTVGGFSGTTPTAGFPQPETTTATTHNNATRRMGDSILRSWTITSTH